MIRDRPALALLLALGFPFCLRGLKRLFFRDSSRLRLLPMNGWSAHVISHRRAMTSRSSLLKECRPGPVLISDKSLRGDLFYRAELFFLIL